MGQRPVVHTLTVLCRVVKHFYRIFASVLSSRHILGKNPQTNGWSWNYLFPNPWVLRVSGMGRYVMPKNVKNCQYHFTLLSSHTVFYRFKSGQTDLKLNRTTIDVRMHTSICMSGLLWFTSVCYDVYGTKHTKLIDRNACRGEWITCRGWICCVRNFELYSNFSWQTPPPPLHDWRVSRLV
jgi:hypothetical protein